MVPARILFADGLNRYVESAHRHCSWLMCVITLEKFAHNRGYTAYQFTEYTYNILHYRIKNASSQLGSATLIRITEEIQVYSI